MNHLSKPLQSYLPLTTPPPQPVFKQKGWVRQKTWSQKKDAWHCPYCNRKQEVVKKLGLWSLPDILVIHLKRFRQSSKQRSTTKLTTLVEFPLYGFDMGPHLADRLPRNNGSNGTGAQNNVSNNYSHGDTIGSVGPLGGLGWSPWKRPRSRHIQRREEDNVYDLYAICNHHGQDLQGGHYTGNILLC
ncbi:hypothetical protein J437_LFUL010651 [Ladona fulva]|uniref:ubiquitinyl hydrolase 1 n=1 Tax=Ladona fulva TaxID=123851 RepID=A0A8K0KSY8_LADFU|nr:hypothetical protein J437_LFUL010651 [Ladona fulva]